MKSRLPLVALPALALFGGLVASRARREPDVVSGFVEADEILVASRAGGRVAKVHVREGSRVSAGEALIELEPFDLEARRRAAAAQLAIREAELARLTAGLRPEEVEQARARRDLAAAEVRKLEAGSRAQEIEEARATVGGAEARLALARAEFARADELLKGGAGSREAFDRAEGDRRVAESALAEAKQRLALLQAGSRDEDLARGRASLAEAEQALALAMGGYRVEEIDGARAAVDAARAALDGLDVLLRELVVVAPCDAVVEAIDLQPGDMVAPDRPAASLIDPTRLWIRAYLPERRIGAATGTRFDARVDAWPGETFECELVFVARRAEFVPGNVQTPEERSKQVFRAKLDVKEGLDRLRPGMSADVLLESARGPAR